MKVKYLNPPRPGQIDLAQPVDWSNPQARGLVAYYPLWLTGSQIAFDMARRLRTIQESGDYPSVSTDATFGRALSFNGSSDRLISTDTPYIFRGYTFSVWFNSTSSTTQQTMFGKGSVDGTEALMYLGLVGDAAGDPVRMGVYDGANSSAANTTTAYPTNQWALATGAVNANGSTVAWLNGGSKGTDATATNEPAGTVMFMGLRYWNSSFDRYFAGKLGEVRVYNRVLSDNEVYNLWQPTTRWSMLRTLTGRRTFYVPAAATDPEANLIGGKLIRGGLLRRRLVA